MDALPKLPGEVTTGAVILLLAYMAWQVLKLIYPISKKKSDDREARLLDVIEKNATAMEKLSSSVDKNTSATIAGTNAIRVSQQREDLYTRMLVEVMRASGRAPESTVPPPPVSTQEDPSIKT